MDRASADSAPRLLAGRYALLRRVGAGMSGCVYAATHVPSGRPVAVRMLHLDTGGSTEVEERILRGARDTARLVHPNVVSVLDVDRGEDGHLFLVQEALEGDDLEERMRSMGPVGVAEALEWILPLSDALALGHAAGLVHRDVKPGNVFLARTPDGREVPKIFDLGASAALEVVRTQLTDAGLLFGTPAYLAPEQVTGSSPVGATADVWSLGVMTYRLLRGHLPFVGRSIYAVMDAIAEGVIPTLHGTVGVPDAVADVVADAMRRDPAERIPTAQELGRRLDRASAPNAREDAGRPTSGGAPPPAEQRFAAALTQGAVAPRVLTAPRELDVPLQPLRFGLAATTDDDADPALSGALTSAVGVPVVALRFRRYEAILDALHDGLLEMAWLPAVAARRALERAPLPLLAAVRRESGPAFASALVVREGHAASLAELEGARAAWVDPWSSSGHAWPRELLVSKGLAPERLLASEAFLGSHGAVLEAVASGRADVGGTYCQVDAEGKLASGPWEARTEGPALVALAVTEPVPPDVLCTAPGAPSALVARLRKALLAVDAEAEATAPLLRRMHARGFATPHPERYRRPGPGQA